MSSPSPQDAARRLSDLMRDTLGVERSVVTSLVLVYAVTRVPGLALRSVTDPDEMLRAQGERDDPVLEDAVNLVRRDLAALPPDVVLEAVNLLTDLHAQDRAETFERLLDAHEAISGRAGGELRTLRWVAELIASVICVDPDKSVLDPACGFGDILNAASRRGAVPNGIDINPTAQTVSRMRMRLHHGGGRIDDGDYLHDWRRYAQDAHAIALSPPWGQRRSKTGPVDVPRWADVGSSLDLAWLVLASESVRDDGQVVAHLPIGVVERSRDVTALATLATRGWLEAIINLGPGAALATDIASVLVLVRPQHASPTTLLIDASTLGEGGREASTAFTDADVRAVRDCVAEFRGLSDQQKATFVRAGLASVIHAAEVTGSAAATLNPSHHVEASESRVELPASPGQLLTELRLEGFKPFKNQTTARLAPITVIYGQNSAGKSSLLQALLLLKQSMEANRFVADGPLARLGSFGALISGHHTERKLRLGVTFGTPTAWHEPGIVLNPAWLRSVDFEFSAASSVDTLLSRVVVSLGDEHDAVFCMGKDGSQLTLSRDRAVALVKYMAQTDARWRIDAPTAKNTETGPDPLNPRRVGVVRRVLGRGLAEVPLATSALVPSQLTVDLAAYGHGGTTNDGDSAFSALSGSLRVVESAGRELARLFSEMEYLGPLRSAPERVYPRRETGGGVGTSGENLAVYLFEHRAELEEINLWLTSLEMPYRLDVTALETGAGGHAVGDLVALLLTDDRSGATLSPADVGFGISQVLPVIVQLLAHRHAVIVIEQPEIHLHPGLQARFADLIIDSAAAEAAANQIIIETHSEHLMLRLQRRVREGELPPSDVSVLYVDWDEVDETAEVTSLPLDDNGSFVAPWPNGFFAERYAEIFGEPGAITDLPAADEDEIP